MSKKDRPVKIHKHTKGKWIVVSNYRNPKVINESGQVIFEHNKNCFDKTERMGVKLNIYYTHRKMIANAKLISIAPELLQIAEMYFDSMINTDAENSIAFDVTLQTLNKLK